jgi:hypothetical protein
MLLVFLGATLSTSLLGLAAVVMSLWQLPEYG